MSNIFFSKISSNDEAHIQLNGSVDKQNYCRIWTDDNLSPIVAIALMHPQNALCNVHFLLEDHVFLKTMLRISVTVNGEHCFDIIGFLSLGPSDKQSICQQANHHPVPQRRDWRSLYLNFLWLSTPPLKLGFNWTEVLLEIYSYTSA